jgi:hypothetical protein
MDHMNWHGRKIPATHNVLAVFTDIEQARHAVGVLQRAGIDAGDIALLGPGAAIAERRASERKPPRAWAKIGGGLAIGALVGMLLGLAVGALVGVMFLDGNSVAALTTAGAAGLVGGSLYGAMRGIGLGDAWEMSQETAPGQVAINVGSDDEHDIAKAKEKLEAEEPMRLTEFDEADLKGNANTRWIRELLETTPSPSPGPISN